MSPPVGACCLIALSLASAGCRSGGWAAGDPVFAEHYARKADSPVSRIKRTFDARQVAGRDGLYVSAAGQADPGGAEVAVGKSLYLPAAAGMAETRLGGRVTALEHEGVAAGVELGTRLQTPTRLAPFIGVVGFAGWTPDALAFGDADVGLAGQESDSGLLSIGPEVGAHLWLTPQWRATAFAAHHFASLPNDNRSAEYTTFGLSLSRFHVPAYRPRSECGDSIETRLAKAAPPSLQTEIAAQELPADADGSPYAGLIGESERGDESLANPSARPDVRLP